MPSYHTNLGFLLFIHLLKKNENQIMGNDIFYFKIVTLPV